MEINLIVHILTDLIMKHAIMDLCCVCLVLFVILYFICFICHCICVGVCGWGCRGVWGWMGVCVGVFAYLVFIL